MSDEMNSGRVQSPLARPQGIWNQPGFATCARGIREVVGGESSLARDNWRDREAASQKQAPARSNYRQCSQLKELATLLQAR
jgi:hypothetical protein